MSRENPTSTAPGCGASSLPMPSATASPPPSSDQADGDHGQQARPAADCGRGARSVTVGLGSWGSGRRVVAVPLGVVGMSSADGGAGSPAAGFAMKPGFSQLAPGSG